MNIAARRLDTRRFRAFAAGQAAMSHASRAPGAAVMQPAIAARRECTTAVVANMTGARA
jgi:hypothetical protein